MRGGEAQQKAWVFTGGAAWISRSYSFKTSHSFTRAPYQSPSTPRFKPFTQLLTDSPASFSRSPSHSNQFYGVFIYQGRCTHSNVYTPPSLPRATIPPLFFFSNFFSICLVITADAPVGVYLIYLATGQIYLFICNIIHCLWTLHSLDPSVPETVNTYSGREARSGEASLRQTFCQ